MAACVDPRHIRGAMRRFGSLVVAFASIACSSGSGAAPPSGPVAFSAQPLMSVTSGTGKLRIDVRTAPEQPPSRGVQTVELVISNAVSGAPEPGLSLDVLPWMPAMGHGAPLSPTVVEDPGGVYVIGDVDFFMAGTWELRTSFSGSVEDYAAPSFQIP